MNKLHPVENAFTIDVEDYFQVAAFADQISVHDWGKSHLPYHVEKNTDSILGLLAKHDTKATFFVLGWIAQKFPQLVDQIASQGHEIASHGTMHQKATTQTKDVFLHDILESKKILESITGKEVVGYRAPSFSIDTSNEWAFDALVEAGFTFSSSTYPVKHDLYGVPDWPRFKHLKSNGLTELPIPTVSILGRNIPIGGGGYFRLLPYSISRKLIIKFLKEENQPYSFYFHPWEIDPSQPRIAGCSHKSRFRHYVNLNVMESKLDRLLSDFSWNTMSIAYQLNGSEK